VATDQRGLDYLSNTATDRITKDLDEFAQKIDPDDVTHTRQIACSFSAGE
jgi:hypothetical protein